LAAIVFDTVALVAPELGTYVDTGTLTVESGRIVFRGAGPAPELVLESVTQVRAEEGLTRVDLADGRSAVFADLGAGSIKAKLRAEPFAEELRRALEATAQPDRPFGDPTTARVRVFVIAVIVLLVGIALVAYAMSGTPG
jgi:hypothetical protein